MRLVTCDDKGCNLEDSHHKGKGSESDNNITIMSGAGNSGLGAEASSYLIPIKPGSTTNALGNNIEVKKKRKRRAQSGSGSVKPAAKKQSGAGRKKRTVRKKKTVKSKVKVLAAGRIKKKGKQGGSIRKRRCVK